jgi:16S rRNA (cytosine967-C5)-methyltransferase
MSRAAQADAPHTQVSPGRRCAFRVLRRVTDEGAFADRAFRAEAERARLDPRERAFAQQLAYGTVQREGTLDWLIGKLASRPADELDPPLRDALRLGLFQLLFLDGVPDHAAVGQTVELAKTGRGGGHRLANAVMRRATRDGRSLLDSLDDSDPAHAALKESHPEWIARMWWEALGPDEAVQLMQRDNEPPESAVRVNELRATRDELVAELASLGAEPRPAADLPEGIVLGAPFDVHGSAPFASGALMPQSRASMTVARVVAPQPGERVLDLCAAPGAKTTHLAALMGNRGEVVAVEQHAGRAEALRENCARLGASIVEVRTGDAADPLAGDGFDRVLLDPPCSDLGTLQARPDVRWRKSPAALEGLRAEQERLLAAAAARVRAGGVLVYSTCTVSPGENEGRMFAFLDANPDFSADDLGAERPDARHPRDGRFLQLLPHRHGTDGFFIARLRRAA